MIPSNSFNGSIYQLKAHPDGSVWAAGSFTGTTTHVVNHIARWNGTDWLQVGAGADELVTDLAVLANGDVIAAGKFSNMDGVPLTSGVARWNGTAWSALGNGINLGSNGQVNALAILRGGDLVAAGESLGSDALRRFDGVSWTPLIANSPEAYGLLVQPNGNLLVVHNPHEHNGHVAGWLSEVGSATCAATVTSIATLCPAPAGPFTLATTTMPWLGEACEMTTTGFTANCIGISVFGVTSPDLPLAIVWPNALPGCNLLASTEVLGLHLPVAGQATTQLAIPSTTALVHADIFHQFAQVQITQLGQLGALSVSNGLQLTIGAF